MDDLLVEFLDEALESLNGLQAALVRLAAWPASSATLGDAVSRLHGLKGVCSFLGLPRAEALAHSAESLVTALNGRTQISPDAIALLGRTLDRLHDLVQAAVAEGAEPAGADADLAGPLGHLTKALTLGSPGAPVLSQAAAEAASASSPSEAIAVGEVWRGLAPFANRLGERLGKSVGVIMEGGAVPAPRAAAPALRAALIALIRNACDHGIETAAERVAAGKPARASLRLSAHAARGVVRIALADDGRGVSRALRRRMFTPGFSTATDISLLSGRGMGLCLVRAEIARLGGQVELASVPGRGATFTLTVPAVSAPASAELRPAA